MRSVTFILGLICVLASQAAAQPYFITDCASTVTTCLKPGSCTHGIISASAEATNGCLSGAINYTWQLDLNNDQSINRIGGSNFFNDSLPVGTHRIIFKAIDACFLSSTCEVIAVVKDCLPPVISAIGSFSAPLDIGDSCRLRVNVSQFLLNYSDNCTPKSQIKLGMRKAGTGTGFPSDTTATFGRCERGTNVIQLWARDQGGLLAQVNVLLLVQDAQNLCPCDTMTPIPPNPGPSPTQEFIRGCVRWPDSTAFELPYLLQLSNFTLPGTIAGTTGIAQDSTCFVIAKDTLLQLPIPITGYSSESVLYEVNSLDVLKIQRHILGLTPLPNVFAQAAADVNGTGTITVSDIVQIRRVILGGDSVFSGVPSFQFFSARGYSAFGKLLQFDTARISPTLPPNDFIAIKSGNVDQFTQGKLQNQQDRAALPLLYEVAMLTHNEGKIILKAAADAQNTAGWQFGLESPTHLSIAEKQFTDFELEQTSKGQIRLLSNYPQSRNLTAGDVVAELPFSLASAHLLPDFNLDKSFEAMWITETPDGQLIPQNMTLSQAKLQSRSLEIAPNPVKAGQNIRITNAPTSAWRLMHTSGQIQAFGANSNEITAPNVAGLYFLQVGNEVVKVVVE
jgi:hypothetical protein